MKKILGLVVTLTVLALGTNVFAAAFTAGNIVIYRVGDGTQVISNTGNTAFLDEFTQAGTWVQSIMMPTNWYGANAPLIADGAAFAEGLITRSTDGRFIVLTGFGGTPGQFTNFSILSSFASNEAPRIVGLVDGSGYIDTSTVQTNLLAEEEIRTAMSTDGTNLWYGGDTTGIKATMRGSALATQVCDQVTNIRQIEIYSNQLYLSTASGSAIRLGNATNTFLPTTATALYASLPGVYTNNGSPFGFVLFNLSGGTNAADTAYITESATNYPPEGNAGVVYKYTLIGGTNWVNSGSIGAGGATGLAGFKDNAGVHLFVTAGGSGTPNANGTLYPYLDTSGYSGDPGTNGDGGDANITGLTLVPNGLSPTTFNVRGVALVPQGSDSPTNGAGRISVGPIYGVKAFGKVGGPVATTNFAYSVANFGTNSVSWQVGPPALPGWLTATPPSGSLSPLGSITVNISINANANSLPGGTNVASITFTNTTAGNIGSDTTTRQLTLILSQIAVTPSTNYFASGPVNGPFTPGTKVYTVTNSSATSLTWGASNLSSNWLTLSATSGTIPAGGSANVTVSINANANALSRGAFLDTVVFTNAATSDPGNTSRTVSLLVGGGFTSNNLVIYRAGDGVAALNNQPTPVFLDEYTRGGLLVQSVPVSTNNYGCSGTATAEGLMTRSTDKQYVVFVGYGTNKTYGAPAPASLSTGVAAVARVIGRVDGNGNVDVSTRLTDFASGTNPRAAVSTNGVDMWVAGAANGIRHTSLGSTTSSDVCTNPVQNFRALNIYSNQLYAGSASGTIRIGTVGSGLPTSDTTIVDLPGTPTAGGSPYNFVLFKLKVGGTDPFDTLYYADDTPGAVYKYSLVGGTWTSNGFGSVTFARGLAGDVTIVGNTTNVNLFIVGSTSTASGSGTLTTYTDTNGWNAAPAGNGGVIGTTLAVVPTNERWDSIALAPEIPATAALSLTPGDFIVTDGPSTVTTNSKNYLVSDVSNSSMTWTATWTSTWLSLSTYGGTLAAGANTNVVVSINGNATSLANGTYLDTVSYVNINNGQGNTTRGVSLTVTGAVADAFSTWQNQYFGCTGCPQAQPGADPFGKGISNTNQFLAGFDPTNRSAYVHITGLSKTNTTDVRVDYLGASGNSIAAPPLGSRTNVLEFTAGTGNGSYNSNSFASTGQTNILSGGMGLGTLTNMVDPGGATNAPSRYYRVRVLVP